MKFIVFFSILIAQRSAFAIPAAGHKIMVAAPSYRAVEVGQSVAKRGGNVFDVAIAVELTLAVTSPYYASLGGGGFAMIRKVGSPIEAIDFRETAPGQTNESFYKEKPEGASTNGPLAVGVPGIPAGIWAIHQKYGKLKWNQLFEEPIRLAEEGFPVSGEWVRITGEEKKYFNDASNKFFLKNGSAYKPGELLRQPQLAKALRALRDQGPKAFYQGDIGKDVVTTLVKGGGVMNLEDLKKYNVRWLQPITKDFLGHKIYMMPPPSSSGVVTSSIITLAEELNLMKYSPMSSQEYHYLAEIFRIAFRGRTLLGDPDFHSNPIEMLTSTSYLKPLAAKVKANKISALTPLKDDTGKKESTETTNFTVMDTDGNTLVMTITLNGSYGSGVTSDKYGIALNNQMDDFTTQLDKPNMYGLIQGKGNLVQAGKRPLSSMSPTIITKDDKTVLGVGAQGGPRIITTVFQSWYRVLANNYDMDKAIQTPRIHHQFLPNTIFVDSKFSPDTKAALEKIGHKVETSWAGRAYGIQRKDDGILEGAFDSRGEGGAGGI